MRQTIPQTPAERDRARLIERPDGFYWQSRDDGREYGPFATLLEAMQDMQATDDDEAVPEEAGRDIAEAEADLGIPAGAEEESIDLEEQ